MAPTHLATTTRPFQAGDESAFRTLNEEWISKYFGMEDKDRITLGDPAAGSISPCRVMAVAERYRGQRIGRKLLEHVVDQAKALGTRRLFLETNSKLANAIHLSESVGFRHLPSERVTPSPYARSDVSMEMWL